MLLLCQLLETNAMPSPFNHECFQVNNSLLPEFVVGPLREIVFIIVGWPDHHLFSQLPSIKRVAIAAPFP
jgi:hypothetical protein